jgi:hypothetical protein
MNSQAHAAVNTVGVHTVVMLWVGVTSALMILLISVAYFDVPLAVVGGGVVAYSIIRLLRIEVAWQLRRVSVWVVAILAAALLLRLDLFPNLMGGQDQGLYTNLARVLLRERSLVFDDAFRSQLPSALQLLYDQSHMASVTALGAGRFTIDFYPLHPAWMAASGWLLGNRYFTGSLLFFSFLGLVGAYRLAGELYDSRVAARLALALFGLNPALVFFAKFPVAETVASAFAVNGFLFWLRGSRTDNARLRVFFYAVSLLCFNGLFYTRPQFIIYLPFIVLLVCGCFLPIAASEKRVSCLRFSAALLLVFGVSLLFYRFVQPTLFEAMVYDHFANVANSSRMYLVLVVATTAIAGAFGVAWLTWQLNSRGVDMRLRLYSFAAATAPYLIALAVLAAIPSIIALYQTGEMSPFHFSVPVGEDAFIIRYHVVYRWAQLVSPIGLLLLIALPAFRMQWSLPAWLAVAFLATCFVVVLAQPTIPYLYYYGRYLSSEIVPASLIVLAGLFAALWQRRHRRTVVVLLTPILVYFAAFSAVQYGRVESETTAFYGEVARITTPNDVIVFPDKIDQLTVALRLSYGRQVFVLVPSRADLASPGETLRALLDWSTSSAARVIVASTARVDSRGFRFLGAFEFGYNFFTNGEHAHHLGIYQPQRFSRLLLPYHHVGKPRRARRETWRFYEVEADAQIGDVCSGTIDVALGGAYAPDLTGFGAPEREGRLLDGPSGRFRCSVPADGAVPHSVSIDATAFGGTTRRVQISVNGATPLEYVFDPTQPHRVLSIPITTSAGRKVVVDFRLPGAVAPAEEGSNRAARRDSISVKSFRFE